MVVDKVADKVAYRVAGMVVDKVVRGRGSGVRWVRAGGLEVWDQRAPKLLC